MSTSDDWISEAAATLDLPTEVLTAVLADELLGLTRDVAHTVARIAGPLTCYLVGVAVGRGMEPSIAIATVTQLLAGRPAIQDAGGPAS